MLEQLGSGHEASWHVCRVTVEDVAPPPAPPGHAEVLADLDVAAAVGLMGASAAMGVKGAPVAAVPGWCTPSTAEALRRSQARPWRLGSMSGRALPH